MYQARRIPFCFTFIVFFVVTGEAFAVAAIQIRLKKILNIRVELMFLIRHFFHHFKLRLGRLKSP